MKFRRCPYLRQSDFYLSLSARLSLALHLANKSFVRIPAHKNPCIYIEIRQSH